MKKFNINPLDMNNRTTYQRPFLYLLSIVFFLAYSCGGDDDSFEPQNQNPPDDPDPVATGIGANGGTVTSDDGKVKIVVPSGALKSNVDIKVEKSTASSIERDEVSPIGDIYRLLPSGTTFEKPVSIEMDVEDSSEIDADQVAVGHWTNEADLEFLEVLDINGSKIKFEVSSFSLIELFEVQSGYTFVPDSNFEQALIDLEYDDDLDYFVLTSEIQKVKNLDLSYNDSKEFNYPGVITLNIKSFRGLQNFTNLDSLNIDYHGYYNGGIRSFNVRKMKDLKYLSCRDSYQGALDISQNTKLNELWARYNGLESIDLSNNTELLLVSLDGNSIENIDLSKNAKVQRLYLSGNKLKYLDLSVIRDLYILGIGENPGISFDFHPETKLRAFFCDRNELTEIDLSPDHFSELRSLYCHFNELVTTIDLSFTPKLERISSDYTPFETLDLSYTPNMEVLHIGQTQLSELDVSMLPKLFTLIVSSPKLTKLNLKNGNNKQMTNFRFIGSEDLTCIQVDDEQWATGSWSGLLSSGQYYSEDCGY